MENYKLLKTDGSEIFHGNYIEAIKELFRIANNNGLLDVKHNEKYNATEFEFEGYYCKFSVLMNMIKSE